LSPQYVYPTTPSKKTPIRVTTDILFFRKRLPNEPQPEHPVWIDSVSHVVPGYGDPAAVNYNAYFDEHPEMVLGVHSAESRMYGRKDYTLKPFEGDTSIVERLRAAIETLPETSSHRTIHLSPRIHGIAETPLRSFPHQIPSRIIRTSSTKEPSGSTTTAPELHCHARCRAGVFSFN